MAGSRTPAKLSPALALLARHSRYGVSPPRILGTGESRSHLGCGRNGFVGALEMSKIGGALALVVLALAGCAGWSAPLPSGGQQTNTQTSPQLGSSVGWLHVEPIAIDFKNGFSHAVTVRVWQRGYSGRFHIRDGCWGVGVYIDRYISHANALFRVQPFARGRERCRVEFSGSPGPRGSQMLQIRVLHR